jgi:pyruvate dehydrogenase E2 component (dihydrolipoamide acetyltransferase)
MPINVTMPALSPTMTEGTLAKWLKKEGDAVNAGDVIAEIETDKATMEVEAVDEGILGKILVPAGTENVPVNDVIAVLLEEGEDKGSLKNFDASESLKKPSPVVADAPTPSPSGRGNYAEGGRGEGSQNRIFASPLARRLAKDKGLNLSSIKGTGPHGRVIKSDVLNYKGSAGAPASGGAAMAAGVDARKIADAYGMEYTEIPNNNIKKVTAKRLLEAKQTIPHFYLTVDCILDNLLSARQQINDAAGGTYKLSVNDFVIKASAMALKAYPAANVAWTDSAVLQFKHADISVAVATPNGLITPIIKKAETKALKDISAEMKDLAGRAKEGKLKPEEFQGGTFSISNLGMFGVGHFQAIVNPPQSCIMAVGAGIEKPIVVDGKIEIRTVMSVTLSTDHRSVDGAVGAEFLQHFKRFIENPVSLFV